MGWVPGCRFQPWSRMRGMGGLGLPDSLPFLITVGPLGGAQGPGVHQWKGETLVGLRVHVCESDRHLHPLGSSKPCARALVFRPLVNPVIDPVGVQPQASGDSLRVVWPCVGALRHHLTSHRKPGREAKSLLFTPSAAEALGATSHSRGLRASWAAKCSTRALTLLLNFPAVGQALRTPCSSVHPEDTLQLRLGLLLP